jgi:alpha-galactosidase
MWNLLHRLRDPFQGNEAAWMMVAPDKSKALVFHVGGIVEANLAGTLLRLRGLDATAFYRVTGFAQTVKGDVLLNVGLPVPWTKGDFSSRRWHLQRA